MKTKIVICDDDNIILDVLSTALMDVNRDIMLTSDSSTLIKLIQQNDPNLLIIDYEMPLGRGDAIVRQLRRSEKYRQLPIILMSAYIKGREIAIDCGANGFLTKPFDLDDLYTMVNTLTIHAKPLHF